jgi:hypothetical protein
MAYQLVSSVESAASLGRRQPYGIIAALAISLGLHALLLFAYRYKPPAASSSAPPRPIAVWLRPAEPAPRPELKPAEPARQNRPKRRAAPRTEVIAVPKRARSAPDAFSVEPSTPAPAPRFDPEAARALARQLADEPDPAKAGTALERLPQKPLASETRMARAISSAKRRDCKDGLPGGLLGPLLLLMDKKDSGCKW